MAANIVGFMPRRRKQPLFRTNIYSIEKLTEREVKDRYRFSKNGLNYICDLVKDDIKRNTSRNHALSVEDQVLVTLRYLASGNFLQVVGDSFGIDKSSVSRSITTVCEAICSHKNTFIKFKMNEGEKVTVRNGFYKTGGFPNVIGCVDGTHIKVQAPTVDEKSYVNRKCYHSINVMAVCDHEGRFTFVNAKWPGSAHDSHVFTNSSLGGYLETQHRTIEDGVLLGDSGYPCRPYLLTPYRDTGDDRGRQRYQTCHMCTRSTIERTFGRWKRRFHVLHSEIRMTPAKACLIILTCAILHNMAIELNDMIDDDIHVDAQPDTPPYQGSETGKGIRDHYAQQYFNVRR